MAITYSAVWLSSCTGKASDVLKKKLNSEDSGERLEIDYSGDSLAHGEDSDLFIELPRPVQTLGRVGSWVV